MLFSWHSDGAGQKEGWEACAGCPEFAEELNGSCQCILAKHDAGLPLRCIPEEPSPCNHIHFSFCGRSELSRAET